MRLFLPHSHVRFLLGLAFLSASPAWLQAEPQAARLWTNKEGRSVTATFVEMAGTQVVILLPNGSRSQVPLDTLSPADQAYVKGLAAGINAASSSSAGPLTWPSANLAIDPKTIQVVEGVQDPKTSRYRYTVGNFEFIATAPLAKSVMAEVASDFLLTEKFFSVQPWGWQPKPPKGDRYVIYMAADDGDYLTLGGRENNASEMVNDDCLIRFKALGLKLVGARYQYDSRAKDAGQITAIVSYAMLGDVRNWLQNWTSQGMSNFLRFVAYQNNGTVRFSEMDTSMRRAIKERLEIAQVTPNLNRMLALMRPTRERRSDELRARLELQLDGFMLIYYFGFLDGDGQGTALHQYYRNIFARAKRSQNPEEAAAMLAASGLERASPEELLNKLLAGRDDATLGAEMTEKFKRIGVRF